MGTWIPGQFCYLRSCYQLVYLLAIVHVEDQMWHSLPHITVQKIRILHRSGGSGLDETEILVNPIDEMTGYLFVWTRCMSAHLLDNLMTRGERGRG